MSKAACGAVGLELMDGAYVSGIADLSERLS